MAESELEGRLLKQINALRSQMNSLNAQVTRVHKQITHPAAMGVIKQYIDTPVVALTTRVTVLETKFGVWTDYSATSTVVGWSAFVDKKIFYKITDEIVHVVFYIDGTSNSINTSFTLPESVITDITWGGVIVRCRDNSAYIATPGLVLIDTNIATCYLDGALTVWTNSGTKTIQGQFFFKIA